MNSYRKIKTGFSLLFSAVCILTGAGNVSAQNVISLRPVDTGQEVVTFRIGSGRGGSFDRWAVKTNLPYWAFGANLGAEAGLGAKTSLELSAGANPWNREKYTHILVKPEFRYWLRGRFDGHFFGVHAIYADYTTNHVEVPLLFDKEYEYDGYAFGGGLTYGYLWKWAERWGAEFSAGFGVLQLNYDRTVSPGDTEVFEAKKTYLGPTSLGVKLIFIIK